MDRIVIWGFALALIPLTLAVAWELVVLLRTTFFGQATGESAATPAGQREPSR